MAQRLKLRAVDSEDMSIISACLQDALIAGNDLSFLPGEHRFVLVAQRFKWENCPEFLRPDRAQKPARRIGSSSPSTSSANTTGATPEADRSQLAPTMHVRIPSTALKR